MVCFTPHVFFLTLWLNLQVYYRGCVHKRSLRSTLLDKFMGHNNGSSFHAEFTGQIYRETLLVLFTGLVYLLCFVLLFKPSLRIGFMKRVLQFKLFDQVYGSSLWVVNFLSYFTEKFHFDLPVDDFGSGLYSNLQVKFVWCLNGWNLWNMLTAEFTGVISTHFMTLNFMSIFEVVFLVWVFILMYG